MSDTGNLFDAVMGAPAPSSASLFDAVMTTAPSSGGQGSVFDTVMAGGAPDDPVSAFRAKLTDPKEYARIKRWAGYLGTTPEDPIVQQRLTNPMGFRDYSTLMQLQTTGNTDEVNDLTPEGNAAGTGLKAALMQFGHAGGIFRRRNEALVSRIAAGQELEVGDTRDPSEQLAKGMAGMPRPNLRTFKKIEDMTRAEQDATVPKEIVELVNQYDTPEAPLDAKTRAEAIYAAAQSSAMARAQTREMAAEELALREELTGKTDGFWNSAGILAAKGLPTVGYGQTFLVGSVLTGGLGGAAGLAAGGVKLAATIGSGVLGGLVAGADKTSELLTADVDPSTGEVLAEGTDYDDARLRGYAYGAFESSTEILTGKVLGATFKGLDKVTGGYAGKVVSKGMDEAARQMSKTSIGRGVAELAKGVQRIAGLSATDNPFVEIFGEEGIQQWGDTVFAQRPSDTEAPVYAKNVFNEATGQIEQVEVEPGSDEEKEAKRMFARYGDKSGYAEVGTRQMMIGEKTKDFYDQFFTWDNIVAQAEGFALQYVLTLGSGTLHAVKTKEARSIIDHELLAAGFTNADIIRMTDEQKAEAFNGFYGNEANREEFAKVFKDAGEMLSMSAQRAIDSELFMRTGDAIKPNFKTDIAKGVEGGAATLDDDASGFSVDYSSTLEGTAFTVRDRDGVLAPMTFNTAEEAQKGAEKMSQMKQGRQVHMEKRAEIATRVAQVFAPGRDVILVQTDKDMKAAATKNGANPDKYISGTPGLTAPNGALIINVAANTSFDELVKTVKHETGHSVWDEAGLTKLMEGKTLDAIAVEFQKAKIIDPGAVGLAEFVKEVESVRSQSAERGVKLTDAKAVGEVLSMKQEGRTPLFRKRFGDGLVTALRGKDKSAENMKDVRRAVAAIMYSGREAKVDPYGGIDAWKAPAPAFEGDPIAAAGAETGEKGAVEPAQGEESPGAEAVAPDAESAVKPPATKSPEAEAAAKEIKAAFEQKLKAEAPPVEEGAVETPPVVDAAPFEVEGLTFNGVQRIEGMADQQVWTDTTTGGTFYAPGTATAAEVATQRDESRARFVETETPPLNLDGGTPADIAADAAKVEAQRKEQETKDEIDKKAAAPLKGDMGDTTPPLPGMEGVAPDDLELLNQKPKQAPDTADQAPAAEEAEPQVARVSAEVEFDAVPEKGQYVEIPGVATAQGKRMYLIQGKWGDGSTFHVSPTHHGTVLTGMGALLRTKGNSSAHSGVRIIGGGKAPAGSEKWGVAEWATHNQKLANRHKEGAKPAPKAPFAPTAEAKPVEAPKIEAPKVEAPPAPPAKQKKRFASEAELLAYLDANPEAATWTEEDFEIVADEAQPAEDVITPAPEAPAAPTKAEFVPPLKKIGENNVAYKRRTEALRKEWEAAQAAIAPADAKDTEEIAELQANAETQARVRAIPDDVYIDNPALAVMDVEIPAYEARKASSTRTADSKERQAYSTPPPLAAIGAEAAMGTERDGTWVTIVEPTAGNGGLLAPLRSPDMILANELDAGRSARLTDLLIKEMRTAAQIFTGDYAAEGFQNAIQDAAAKGKRAFLMNPPFGPADESGYKLEHRIALKTIESAKPGDTLFFIGAAPGRDAMKMTTGALAGVYTSGAFAKFHGELNRQGWKATLHFIADGALYRKMGASFPVEVLLMEKTNGKEQNPHMPMRDIPARYSTWEQIRAAVAEMYEPGAMTIGERVAAGLEANADAARAEAQGNAEASSPEVNAARVKETGEIRYRLSQDIELGLVTPETGLPVSSVMVRTVYGKVWDGEFAGVVHNPTQLAGRILTLPSEIAEARIRTADAIVAHLRANPANGFNVSPGYVSMGPAMREAFESRWNAERPSSMEEAGGRAQVEYSPLSTVEVASPMKIPIELAGGIATALNDFADRHPDGIDAFVAEKMGWSLGQTRDGRLDGSQIDALGLAIEKIDEGTGMIVGSMTGAGKGRVMASIMDYHRKQGRAPIFLTAQAKLFTDIWRDLTATGAADDLKPLVLNDYKAPKSEDPDSVDEDAFTMPMFFTSVQRGSALSEGRLPQGANAIFLTYSQVQNPTASTRRKIDLIKKLLASGKGALVMDEAHLAAGADSNRGAVLREFADLAKSGVVFSSATFAKRGENMTLYKRAGYSQFFKNDMEMEQALLVGGVPFQQYLAARLTERGFYVRHELDYEGVVFEKLTTIDTLGTAQERTALSQREEQIADVYNQAVRTVMRFGAMVKAVNSRLQKGAPGANMDGAAFMSSLHNTASFIYTALKAETVANAAVAELRAGRAPVVTLYNTNQALLTEIGLNQAADVGRYLTRIAERAVAIQMPDGSTASILTGAGYAELVRLVKEQDARLLREAADALVRQSNSAAEYLREQNLPASPIDRVREIVENAGYQFGEVTGRTLMARNGVVTRRAKPNPDIIIRQFNHGGTDGSPNMVLLLNSSGSTGLSAHASRDFRNQARRVMFVLQPSWDINEMMQMFGRVNRKAQVSKPVYQLVFTSAAGEQRNAAILMSKLRSLAANTSGVSRAGYGETVEDALDFMNAFGDRALAELAKERNPVVASINTLRQSTSIRSATSISQFLPVREQEQFIGQIQAKVAALQDNAREAGLHDLEAGDIGRVPLSVEQLLSNAQMRAYEVPVLGRGKILTASEAVEAARAWQAQHPALLDNAKPKIDKAIADTSNPWLKRIYGDTAQVLEHALDSIGQVYFVRDELDGGRRWFIPMEVHLPPSGTAQTASDWRVKVSFNTIRGVTTIPLSIFADKILSNAGMSSERNYNDTLTRKEDRTIIAGDVAQALIGNIVSTGASGSSQIVRALPVDGNFSSFVLMMPRGVTVANAKKIVTARLENVTDVLDIRPPSRGGSLEIDAGRVKVTPTYSTRTGDQIGAVFAFRIATPNKSKSKDVTVAQLMRAAGAESRLKDTPDSRGYVTGPYLGVDEANTALKDLAALHPALQATQIVSDEGRVGGQATPVADAPRFRLAGVKLDADYLRAVEAGDMETAQRMVDARLGEVGAMWHGTPSGDLRGGISGLHVGTKQAATEALEARIGIPADGKGWDGTREYGKTLLAGRNRIESGQFGKYRLTGYNAGEPGKSLPLDDFYPADYAVAATVGNGVKVDFSWKPYVRPVLVVGETSNSRFSPMSDSRANAQMKAGLKKGNARRGFFYRNEAEDIGSVSAVFPDGESIRVKLPDAVTYDDAGNVIPLSERFNEASDDIRFRLPGVSLDDLSAPVRVGELRRQKDLENDDPVGFPILDHIRGGSRIVIPRGNLGKKGEYNWFTEAGGLRAFNLAEQKAFFRHPKAALGEKKSHGNIDTLAKELATQLGTEDVETFANAFMAEVERSRALYREQKERQARRRSALEAVSEHRMFKGKANIGETMGRAIGSVYRGMQGEDKTTLDMIRANEGDEAAQDYILMNHFEKVVLNMDEHYAFIEGIYEPPAIIEDQSLSIEVPTGENGETRSAYAQNKETLRILAARLYTSNPEGVAKITDEGAAAFVREALDAGGPEFLREQAEKMVAERLTGQRDTALNKYQTAVMLWYQTDLDAQTKEKDGEARDAAATNNISALNSVDMFRDRIHAKTLDYLNAARQYGSLAGQALQALKLRVDHSFNIVKIYRQAFEDNGDIALTPQQYAALKARVDALEKKWNDYVEAASLPDGEAELDARVVELEKLLADATTNRDSLKATVGQLETKKTALESEYAKQSATATELSEQKAQLEAQIAGLENEIAMREALNQEVGALQAKVDALQAKIDALDAEYAGASPELLASLEKRLADLTSLYNRKLADYTQAEEDLKAANARLKRVQKLIEKLGKGEKAKIVRRRAVLNQAANLYGAFKTEMEAAQVERMKNRWRGANPAGKALMTVAVTRDMIRALQSMADESVAGRQLAKLGLAHPILWARAWAQSQQLVFSRAGAVAEDGHLLTWAERSDRRLFELDQTMREHPMFDVLVRKGGKLSKLSWMDLTADPSSFDEQQTPVGPLLRSMLPSKFTRVYTSLLGVSNNQYAGMSNMLRFAAATQLYEQFNIATGKTPTAEDIDAIVSTVDIFGGRGNLSSERAKSFVKFAGHFLYSPRLAISNVQFFKRMAGFAIDPSTSGRAKAMIATEYLRLGASYAVISILFRLISKMFSDDPDEQRFQFRPGHSAFLTLMRGQRRFDFTGGAALWARSVSQILGFGDKLDTETGLVTQEWADRQNLNWNAVGRLVRSKMDPWTGMMTDLVAGKTYRGQAAGPRAKANFPDYAWRYPNLVSSIAPVPLGFQSIVDLLRGDTEQGIAPLRNPLHLLEAVGAQIIGTGASNLPVNSELAQEVDDDYTRNAEELETLKNRLDGVLSDRKMSPEMKEFKAERLQDKIDQLRGL